MLTTSRTDHEFSSIRIQSARLTLREFNVEDLSHVQDYLSNPEVLRYFQLPWGAESLHVMPHFIKALTARRRQAPRCYFDLAIDCAHEPALLGGCGLYIFSEANREGTIHYWLARQFWSKGYATEAVKTLLRFGFEQITLHRIFAICDVGNTASARVLEKSGMRREGELREHLWHNDNWRSSYLYAALAHQWAPPEADAPNC